MQAQYVFLHDALLEALECGETEVSARNLFNHYKYLSAVDPETRKTRLELEFNKLASTIHRNQTRINATMPSNRAKNRFHDDDVTPCRFKCTVEIVVSLL